MLFRSLLFLMIAKADPENRAKLRLGFPEHVKMWEDWYNNPHP